jgi:hypothetical protein
MVVKAPEIVVALAVLIPLSLPWELPPAVVSLLLLPWELPPAVVEVSAVVASVLVAAAVTAHDQPDTVAPI